MLFKKELGQKHSRQFSYILFIGVLISFVVVAADAQTPKKARAIMRSISSGMPSGYVQVGNTDLCFSKSVYSYNGNCHSIDIQGKFDSNYYGSTYSNCGYDVAIQVGNNSAEFLDCLNGSTVNGVKFEADVVAQADLARVCYFITNTNDKDTIVSLGIHADVMIGNNDAAPIVRKIDTIGNTYGLALLDGNGAQLCVLFGTGLPGVTGVSDFWFGRWSLNSSPSEMVGNYSQGGNWMVENGSYDSGMGWCWKNRTIPAGATVTFSWLIGVGDVNLEPNSNFEVTPEDPDGWNDLSRLHVLTLEGDYESPAGLGGRVEYAVEDTEEWIALTEMLESGSSFIGEVRAMFNPDLSTHTIRFRTVDQVGNTTLLPSIVYPDVAYHAINGVTDKIYTGDSIFQTELTSDLVPDQYTAKNYQNNVNVGMASFNVEGVFPYTIGRKTYSFNITPQTLSGDLALSETEFVYNGYSFTPDWQFTNANYSNLQLNNDFTVTWSNNRLPGIGTLTVTGKKNYTGSLSANFEIDKAPLRDNLFTLTLPEEDITYDEQSHGATISTSNGVGQPTITYLKQGEIEASTTPPTDAGDYTIYLTFADGSLYYGRESTQVGQFSIYQFSADEWAILQTVLPQLTGMGWSQPWDVSQGMKSVSSLQGLTIVEGHVTQFDLSGQNLTGPFPASLLDLPRLQSLDLSNNYLSGNIGQYASSMTNLTSLNVSYNCFDEVSPMIPTTVSNLSLEHQTIDKIVDVSLVNLSSDYLAHQVPNILLYDHAQQSYSSNILLLCSTEDESWSTKLVSHNGQVSFANVSEENVFHGKSGDILNVALLNSNSTREGSTFRIRLSFEQGDANFDGLVNILDLQSMINYMFEEYTNKPFNFTAANLWDDEIVNVQDAVNLVNILLDEEVSPARMANLSRRLDEISSESAAYISIENGQLLINSLVPISAFDIVVSTNQKCEILPALSKMGFTCSVKQKGNQVHLIGYSLNGAVLQIGQTGICSLGEGTIDYAMLANEEAQEINCETRVTTTNIQNSMSKNLSEKEVFRIPVGARRAISVDTTGKKTMIKDEK